MNTSENKSITARWLETAFNNPCDLDKLSELIAKDNPIPFSDNLLSWKFLHTQFTGVKAKIVDQIEEGGKVVTRLDVQGIENGEQKNWEAIYVHTIDNNQIKSGICVTPAPVANVSLIRGSEKDHLVVQ